jgi:hypothetical protein
MVFNQYIPDWTERDALNDYLKRYDEVQYCEFCEKELEDGECVNINCVLNDPEED